MADTLKPGQRLISNNNQELVSQNGYYKLIMQRDGNLVLYTKDGHVLWNTNTQGLDVEYCAMQEDGNLVLYLEESARPVWASDTGGNPGSWLVVQNDGNLVIYKPEPIWDRL